MHIDESQLNDLKVIFEAEDSDIYDVFAHLSFNLKQWYKKLSTKFNNFHNITKHNEKVIQET